jgi:hypothetical protein
MSHVSCLRGDSTPHGFSDDDAGLGELPRRQSAMGREAGQFRGDPLQPVRRSDRPVLSAAGGADHDRRRATRRAGRRSDCTGNDGRLKSAGTRRERLSARPSAPRRVRKMILISVRKLPHGPAEPCGSMRFSSEPKP